jgi:hypothetical protein
MLEGKHNPHNTNVSAGERAQYLEVSAKYDLFLPKPAFFECGRDVVGSSAVCEKDHNVWADILHCPRK